MSVVLSLQASKEQGSRFEDYFRVALPEGASVGDVRAAFDRLVREWRGKGDGSTLVEFRHAGKTRWKKGQQQAGEPAAEGER